MDKINKTVFIISFLISWIAMDSFALLLQPAKSVVFVYADWCGPCRVAHKEINNPDSLVSLALKKYKLKKTNFDLDKATVEKYNIKAVPTFILLDGDTEIARLVGLKNGVSDLIAFLLDNE